jgi:hypothetical protein
MSWFEGGTRKWANGQMGAGDGFFEFVFIFFRGIKNEAVKSY